MTKPISTTRDAIAVWMGSYIFFLFTLANNFSASHDSINYLLAITKGEHLFHQHHLLYHFFAYYWLQLFQPIFTSVPEHYIIEAFTAFWGSANIAVCYLFFRNRFGLTIPMALAGVSVIAFSYGAWFYSINIEVYAPPIFFILSALYRMTTNQPHRSDVMAVAVLQSCAVLFHQLNVLFTITVVYWLLVTRKNANGFGSFIKYAFTAFIICSIAYFYAGWIAEHKNSLDEFSNWVLGYTKGHSYWQPLSAKTPVNAATGFARAFVGGHFIFQHPYFQHFIENSFRAHGLTDEIFLAKNLSIALTWALTILLLLFGILIVVLCVRFARKYSSMTLHAQVIHPLIVTIIVYSVFFCFWMPEILEFWILQMILVWLLLIGMLPLYRFPFRIKPFSGIILVSAMLFVMNYFGSIKWLRNFDNDWYYVEIGKIEKGLSQNDIVILEDEWILKDYVRYYTKASVIATDEPTYNKSEASNKVRDAISNHHRVILYRRHDANPWTAIQSY